MKNKVIEYVMSSPGNTNRAVLESMLEAINGGGSSKYEAEFPIAENQVLRVFSAPLQDGVHVDVAGTSVRKVWDDLPNINGAVACSVVYIQDIESSAATISGNTLRDTFVVNAEQGLAAIFDDSGIVFVSADLDNMDEDTAAELGVPESGVYFREDIGFGMYGYIALLFACEV